VKLKEFKHLENLKIVEKFITEDDELWNRISEDGNKKEDFKLQENHYFWWIGCFNKRGVLVGLFWLHHVNNSSIQIHAHVKKEYREEYSFKCGKEIIKYFAKNFKSYNKLIAEIPVIYQDVIKFTLKFGFKFEGTNRKSVLKNGELLDQNRYGLLKSEVKL
jgi:RimJ/RimL family protein N-acetyltransferase